MAWAERRDGWIVEDDYDSEYRYNGTSLAPLAALDRQGRVLYVGTFCKIAFPPCAWVTWCCRPRWPRRSPAAARWTCVIPTSAAAVMAEFIAAGHFQRHVRRMRQAARARRDTLLQHWPKAIPGCAALPVVDAGLHLCVPVHSQARKPSWWRSAAGGVKMNGLADYWLGGQPPQDAQGGLVLGFAAVPEGEIVAALQRLRHAWRLPPG